MRVVGIILYLADACDSVGGGLIDNHAYVLATLKVEIWREQCRWVSRCQVCMLIKCLEDKQQKQCSNQRSNLPEWNSDLVETCVHWKTQEREPDRKFDHNLTPLEDHGVVLFYHEGALVESKEIEVDILHKSLVVCGTNPRKDSSIWYKRYKVWDQDESKGLPIEEHAMFPFIPLLWLVIVIYLPFFFVVHLELVYLLLSCSHEQPVKRYGWPK